MKLFKRTLFLLLFFYFTFTFTFEFLDSIQRILIYLISAIVVIFNLHYLKSKLPINKKYLRLSFICYLITLLASIIVPILYSTFDFSYCAYVLLAAKLGLKNIVLLIVFLRIFKEKSSFYLFSKYYIMSCCIYICITLIMISMPSFKSFWISIIHINPSSKILTLKEQYVSRVGIDGFAGFTQTFMCSIGVILNAYMIILNNSKLKKNHLLIHLSLFTLITGTFLYGRVGGIISFLVILILIMYYLTKIRNIKRALAIIGVIMLLFLSITHTAKNNDKVNTWLDWSFDYISNYKNTGNLSNASSNMMFNMYFMPETQTILIGDGYYTEQGLGSYYKSTDIGFMRNILFFGIFSTITGYFTIIFILIGFKKCFSKNKNKIGVMLSMLFFVQIIMFEMKGGIHYIMYATLLPFYCVLLYENKKRLLKLGGNNE